VLWSVEDLKFGRWRGRTKEVRVRVTTSNKEKAVAGLQRTEFLERYHTG
jgi:hypothetical protein